MWPTRLSFRGRKVIFSYPMSADDSKKSPKISPYVSRVATALQIPVEIKHQDIADAEDTMAFPGSKQQNISQLVHLLRHQRATNEPVPTLWKYILAYISKDPQANGSCNRFSPASGTRTCRAS